MGMKMTHIPSGTTIELSKEPDLPETIGRSKDQDTVLTGGGLRRIFKRRIDNRPIVLRLRGLNAVDRRRLEQFFWETIEGQKEKFDLEIVVEHEEPLQVASTLDGVPITVGTVLPPRCGDPGGPIQVGDWVPQDTHIYAGMRMTQTEIQFSEGGDMVENYDTTLSMIQELP